MFSITTDNPDEALRHGLTVLDKYGVSRESRDGPVRVLMHPLTTINLRPSQRVIVHPLRDANPFFHLFESMWMLAGENNARFLDRYVRDFSSRYGDERGNIHGAYGARWRGWFTDALDTNEHELMPDQLALVVDLLRENSNSRQVVLTMWSPVDDLGTSVKDRPCNTHIYLRVRDHDEGPRLDMTVCCRSNDMVMGAYGANIVHMSVLMEYISVATGIPMGIYYQVSNDFHAYVRDLKKFGDLPMPLPHFHSVYDGHPSSPLFTAEGMESVRPEIRAWLSSPSRIPYRTKNNNRQLFEELLVPMSIAHDMFKERRLGDAVVMLESVQHDDWRIAATEWIQRRMK